ncbi:protein shisa-6-like isoform X1 [Myxocyprinus asiaticus]|uniref:protein shisa-6-like isoform X1 n=1 Tax=Myxocyprinus asiaticus TaxID=70543 RepID=UPI002222F196|nr:protein shisa-6-like isoform X1 [Myxocyprinus asiaticus]XP_051573050.1 protein shisa-6-like isoform X1 [Myxocyprinus asiaticus]
MGIRHLLLLLVYLDPLCVLSASTAKRSKPSPKRPPKVKELNSTVAPSVTPRRITQVQAPIDHDTCLSYYDVSGQYDKEFACNNTDHRYCCGSCFLRFCCPVKAKRVDQRVCTNYNTPDWIKTLPPSPAPTGDTYDPALDQTNTTVYITCGVIAFIIILGISAKVAYDKATRPPQEINVHRALADILRQQGSVPISQYEHENITAIDTSAKENTPVRTSKNHYTPVHNKNNHGHYGKENFRSGQDMHNYISSGFVTLGRGHLKAQHSVDDLGQLSWQGDLDVPLSYNKHQHEYTSHLDLTGSHTPKIGHRIEYYEKPRMNNILTSQTEPYDLSFSRSFQNLTHLLPSYETTMKDLSDKDDEYYIRKHHLPDLAPRGGNLQSHMIKLSVEPPAQRQKPKRVQRAMSQDHVLSPARSKPHHDYSIPLYSGGAGGLSPYHGRILSEEQLLSADRLHSQDPLLSPEKMLSLRRSNFREKAMSRALSHTDMFMPTTPVVDRHYKMLKMHSNPSTTNESYNTLTVSSAQSGNKRQAFANRRMHTVDHLQYIPGHHHHQYRTASKTEVTV